MCDIYKLSLYSNKEEQNVERHEGDKRRSNSIGMGTQSSVEHVACIALKVKMVKREVWRAWVKLISSLRNKAVDINI